MLFSLPARHTDRHCVPSIVPLFIQRRNLAHHHRQICGVSGKNKTHLVGETAQDEITGTFHFTSASGRDCSVHFECSYKVVDALGPYQVFKLQNITVILLYHCNCALSLQFLVSTSPIVSCFHWCLNYFPAASFAFMWPSLVFSLAVPSQPPQNVRAITVTSDEAVITWSEPPRMTLNGVLKGYRVVFWSLYPDGGGCCGGQTLRLNQSNYTLLLLLPH